MAAGLIRRYGLRSGITQIAGHWYKERFKLPENLAEHYRFVLTPDCPAVLSPAIGSAALRLTWLVPNFSDASGGHHNIFRTIKYLETKGHRHRIYIVGNSGHTSESATALARSAYFPIESTVEIFAGTVADSDALIATSWETAYAARGIANTAQKYYLVQDLENLFYPAGSLSEFVKRTYTWGFHGITAGDWIANTLSAEYGMRCSGFGFSFDQGIYYAAPRRKRVAKQRLLFYARPSTERRGFELGVLTLSLLASRRSDIEFVLVGLRPREIDLPFACVMPGVLSPKDLSDLYRGCDAALVLSHSNLSLLPLEILACGCPVVSNNGANVEWLLHREIAFLSDPTPESLCGNLQQALTLSPDREARIAAGLRFAQSTSWPIEIDKIERALYEGQMVASGVRA